MDAPGHHGDTALHDACENGHRHIVHFLMQHNADVSIRNAHGDMPVDVTDDDVIKRMLKGEVVREDEIGPRGEVEEKKEKKEKKVKEGKEKVSLKDALKEKVSLKETKETFKDSKVSFKESKESKESSKVSFKESSKESSKETFKESKETNKEKESFKDTLKEKEVTKEKKKKRSRANSDVTSSSLLTPLKEKRDKAGRTMLHKFASMGDIQGIKQCIEAGCGAYLMFV